MPSRRGLEVDRSKQASAHWVDMHQPRDEVVYGRCGERTRDITGSGTFILQIGREPDAKSTFTRISSSKSYTSRVVGEQAPAQTTLIATVGWLIHVARLYNVAFVKLVKNEGFRIKGVLCCSCMLL